jgi:hypothetical protein
MEVVMLGGNSEKNREWIEKVSDNFKSDFSTRIQYYKHWDKENGKADIEYEKDVLYSMIKKKKNYVIFAKSVGIAIAMRAINQFSLEPKLCVFIGLPVSWLNEIGFNIQNELKGFDRKSIFIQNDHDPYCSSEKLVELLDKSDVKNDTLKILIGSNHDYDNLEEIKQTIIKELK